MTSLWDCGGSSGCGLVCTGTTAPVSPSTNDLWFDITNNQWKKWDGAKWAVLPAAGLPQATKKGQVLVSQGTAGFPWAPEDGVIAGNF